MTDDELRRWFAKECLRWEAHRIHCQVNDDHEFEIPFGEDVSENGVYYEDGESACHGRSLLSGWNGLGIVVRYLRGKNRHPVLRVRPEAIEVEFPPQYDFPHVVELAHFGSDADPCLAAIRAAHQAEG